MHTTSILVFLAIFAGGALFYGFIERQVARLPARARWRRGTAATVRRCPRSLAPPLDLPRWSEKAARLFLEGGSC